MIVEEGSGEDWKGGGGRDTMEYGKRWSRLMKKVMMEGTGELLDWSVVSILGVR